MKRMVRMISLGVALLLPAFAASHPNTLNMNAPTSSPAQICAADGSRLLGTAAEYVWRLRAYEELDCALAILDEALAADGGVITISRQKAEQARASIWSARDAAARIGR
jgi:hypothetical protein